MNPTRTQRRPAKGHHKPDSAVYVGRPTQFGNPYHLIHQGTGFSVRYGTHGQGVDTFPTEADARQYATDAYRTWINQPEQQELRNLARTLLPGHNLTCWCPLPEPGQPDHCHAAILLQLANEEATP